MFEDGLIRPNYTVNKTIDSAEHCHILKKPHAAIGEKYLPENLLYFNSF